MGTSVACTCRDARLQITLFLDLWHPRYTTTTLLPQERQPQKQSTEEPHYALQLFLISWDGAACESGDPGPERGAEGGR